MSLLEIEGIKKHFGSVEVLRGVNLAIDGGEVVALVGDNGAGKSTLMKIVTGIYQPDGGAVRFEGKSLTGRKPDEIRRLGIEMIYQDLALAKQQDVAANIFLGREPTRRVLGLPITMIDTPRIEREAEAMIRKLGARLPSVKYQVGKLSGGQQQSVAIARALTFNPKLVIMDEPTAALAVREVEHVLELIRELKRQRIAVILISHRLTDVFAVSDRIVALRQGVVVSDEPVAQTSMNDVVAHIVGAA
ncbi:MAG TPA: ATP-binding cassette domain-containing protein [Candidatus Cybelea sp.]|nr:ATP-binding cassette domain-containing protein [Candidatus Cybelea sp.]